MTFLQKNKRQMKLLLDGVESNSDKNHQSTKFEQYHVFFLVSNVRERQLEPITNPCQRKKEKGKLIR